MFGKPEGDEVVEWHLGDCGWVVEEVEEGRRVEGRGVETGGEFLFEEGERFGAAAFVAEGVFHGDFVGGGAVFKGDVKGACDGALVGIVVVERVGGIFVDGHFFTEEI